MIRLRSTFSSIGRSLGQVHALQAQFSNRWFSGIQKTNHGDDGKTLSISEKEYHVLADATLDEIVDRLSVLEDADGIDEDLLDINCAQGVLNIILGEPGTWVINKQTPNRQLWWSSPISGPRRFDLDLDLGKEDSVSELENGDPVLLVRSWKCSKDGSENLLDALRMEIRQVVEVDILEDE
eukprot:GSChrysophyteH1.ASY1.ANO1.161.1 assembled CDS